jgi:hypothetical protein
LEAKGKMTQGRGGPTGFYYLSHFPGWLFLIGCPFPAPYGSLFFYPPLFFYPMLFIIIGFLRLIKLEKSEKS